MDKNDILPVPVQEAKKYLSPIQLMQYSDAYIAFYNIRPWTPLEDMKRAKGCMYRTAKELPKNTPARADMKLKGKQLNHLIYDIEKSNERTLRRVWGI